MIPYLKKNFWYIVGGVVILAMTILLRDLDRLEELKSFFRRKRVEDDVSKIKEKISAENGHIAANEERLVELAEELERKKKRAEDVTEEEIRDFYERTLQ